MSIYGISSYGMGYYNYQSSINNARLMQALSQNPKLNDLSEIKESYDSSRSSLSDSFDFVKEYTSSMSSLMKAASELKGSGASSAVNDLTVTSSDTSVATVTERLPVRSSGEITLEVSQTARTQINASDAVKANEAAVEDMDFTVSGSHGTAMVQVSSTNDDGTARTSESMLYEAAKQINSQDVGVRATVVEDAGEVSLKLESRHTGEVYGFSAQGQFGAAAGIDRVDTAALNAEYSVTDGGFTRSYTSSTNDITVNSGRIGVSLKDTGEVTISAGMDEEKISAAVQDLVSSYNSALKVLNDNYGRGSGVDRQLRNLVRGLGSEQSLAKVGITVNKDATLEFDQEVFSKSFAEDPSFVRNIISGTGGIADTAFNKASGGMNVNSSSLINNDMAEAQHEILNNPFNVIGMYSRNSAYLNNNFYAVGLMMNYLV